MEVQDGIVRAIRQKMAENGASRLSFRDYMDICLYHPLHGYYMTDRAKIGKDGDYYTAADIGGIMAKVVAHFFAKEASVEKSLRTFVEWGGGTGRTALGILDAWKEEYPELYRETEYILIEKSPYHRARQAGRLAEHADRATVMMEEEWKERRLRTGVFHFSQELLDAFPVHRVVRRDGGLRELFVGWDEARHGFREEDSPCTDPRIGGYLERHGIRLEEGFYAEINLDAEIWILERLRTLDSGRILTVDYGDESRSLYAPDRRLGTLMGYSRHRATEDPYLMPGNQDITAHVNFSALIQAGIEGGAERWRLWRQRDFLVENGVFGLLADTADPDPFHPAARQNRAIRQLLLADRMSELFKVLYQKKG